MVAFIYIGIKAPVKLFGLALLFRFMNSSTQFAGFVQNRNFLTFLQAYFFQISTSICQMLISCTQKLWKWGGPEIKTHQIFLQINLELLTDSRLTKSRTISMFLFLTENEMTSSIHGTPDMKRGIYHEILSRPKSKYKDLAFGWQYNC